jgi:hypothetical protein
MVICRELTAAAPFTQAMRSSVVVIFRKMTGKFCWRGNHKPGVIHDIKRLWVIRSKWELYFAFHYTKRNMVHGRVPATCVVCCMNLIKRGRE